MRVWSRFTSAFGSGRLVAVLGGLYVVFALGRALSEVAGGRSLAGVLANFVLIGLPGVLLLYGGHRLPRTDLHPDVYPRIVAWCLGGFGLLLGVVGLRVFDPGVTIDSPFGSAVLATALGSVAGFAIGMYEARAISRAYEAEQRSRELENYSRELERQNERLESFAGMLAHELRNPLTIAQIYHSQAADGDEDAADQVDTALDRIEEMIDILLVTVRRTDANIDYEPVALGEVAADAWADLSPDAATSLVVETDWTILADRVHVRHLLKNAFGNAIEHGDDGVTVRIGDLDDGAGFYVEDDGPGIPVDERAVVAEAGYTTKRDGIGLGLTFISQLAEIYEWDCTITESEEGGARFEFADVDLVSPEGGSATVRR